MTTLTVFAQNMNQLAAAVQQNIPKMMRGVAEAVVDSVANSTPQLTGQAAGNWKTTVGSPSSAWDQGPNSPSTSLADAAAALSTLREGQVIYISNNVPYIVDLNQGSSAKAPAGFVEMSVMSGVHVAGNFNLLVRP